jgi:hypothetical protein
MPVVWLHAVIVVCAYVGYKATDDFSLLARDALGFDDVQASTIGTLSFTELGRLVRYPITSAYSQYRFPPMIFSMSPSK